LQIKLKQKFVSSVLSMWLAHLTNYMKRIELLLDLYKHLAN
jgi:hypothetical protein